MTTGINRVIAFSVAAKRNPNYESIPDALDSQCLHRLRYTRPSMVAFWKNLMVKLKDISREYGLHGGSGTRRPITTYRSTDQMNTHQSVRVCVSLVQVGHIND